MKILIIASQSRYEKFMPEDGIARRCQLVYRPVGTPDGALLEAAGDAEVILADAIAPVSADLIAQMPNLRLIHSEGLPMTASTGLRPGSGTSTSATTRGPTPRRWRSRRSCSCWGCSALWTRATGQSWRAGRLI